MQFLLIGINSKYIHSNPAIYSLRSYTGESREHVGLAEYTINHDKQEIVSDIFNRKPDAIAFSCYIWNWELIQEIIPVLGMLMPDIPVWLGGPEVSYDAEKILNNYPMIKGIMTGEGEQTFAELLQCYLYADETAIVNHHRNHSPYNIEGRDILSIRGIVFREDEDVFHTPTRECLDFNEVPFPYGELTEFENRIIYYESSRGCPFRCSYCLSAIDKTVRFKNSDLVMKELLFFLDQKVPQVKFIDRTFNCNKEHACNIWRFISENDNKKTNFHFEIAADLLTEEQLEVLSTLRPGLVQLEIGIQSTNKETLKEINRVSDMNVLADAVSKIISFHNIHIHLDLIAGLPCEGIESFKRSFNDVFCMGPHQLQLGFLKVLKGSKMEDKVDEYGIRYWDKPPYEVLFTKWLSYEEVRRLKKVEEMVDIFYNSNQFTNTMVLLIKCFTHPFDLFEELSRFYEEKGYFIRHPARAYRYEILLEFARCYDESHLEIYRELLIYDLYLRENVKSRPEYAAPLHEFKERIYDFYRKEAERGKYLPDYKGYQAKQMLRMTHIEVFYYPVTCIQEAVKGEGEIKKESEPQFVLFDYLRRNELTGNAITQIVLK